MLVLLTYPPLLPPNPPHPNSLPSFSMRDMRRKIIVKIQLLNKIIFLFRLLFSSIIFSLISSLLFTSLQSWLQEYCQSEAKAKMMPRHLPPPLHLT